MDKYLVDFIKENKITEEFYKKHIGTFKRVDESRIICQNCQGLYMCAQKSKGERLGLEKNDILFETIEYCDYLKQQKAKEDIISSYVYSDIPDQYSFLTLNNIPLVDINIKKLCSKALEIYKEKTNKGLYVVGDLGVGKTYMMIALANSLVLKKEKVAFIKMTNFINDLRNTISLNDGSYDSLINSLKKVKYLFIDDIGAESVTSFSRDDVLFNVLEYRLEHNLCTCFTSNYTKDKLEEHYSFDKNGKASSMQAKRLIERIDILAETFVLTGENKRR